MRGIHVWPVQLKNAGAILNVSAGIRTQNDPVLIVLCIQSDADADLLKLVDAVDRSGFFPGLVQGRQQHRRQNRNDRYYYK